MLQGWEMRIDYLDPVRTAEVSERPEKARRTKAEGEEDFDWRTVLIGRGQGESQDRYGRYGAGGQRGIRSFDDNRSKSAGTGELLRKAATPLTPPRLATGQPRTKAWLLRVGSGERTGVFICKYASEHQFGLWAD